MQVKLLQCQFILDSDILSIHLDWWIVKISYPSLLMHYDLMRLMFLLSYRSLLQIGLLRHELFVLYYFIQYTSTGKSCSLGVFFYLYLHFHSLPLPLGKVGSMHN